MTLRLSVEDEFERRCTQLDKADGYEGEVFDMSFLQSVLDRG